MGISEKGKKIALFITIFCTYCQCVLHNVAKFYNVPCYVSSISATMIANSRLMTDWGNRRNWNHAIRSYLPFVINEDFPGFQLASIIEWIARARPFTTAAHALLK